MLFLSLSNILTSSEVSRPVISQREITSIFEAANKLYCYSSKYLTKKSKNISMQGLHVTSNQYRPFVEPEYELLKMYGLEQLSTNELNHFFKNSNSLTKEKINELLIATTKLSTKVSPDTRLSVAYNPTNLKRQDLNNAYELIKSYGLQHQPLSWTIHLLNKLKTRASNPLYIDTVKILKTFVEQYMEKSDEPLSINYSDITTVNALKALLESDYNPQKKITANLLNNYYTRRLNDWELFGKYNANEMQNIYDVFIFLKNKFDKKNVNTAYDKQHYKNKTTYQELDAEGKKLYDAFTSSKDNKEFDSLNPKNRLYLRSLGINPWSNFTEKIKIPLIFDDMYEDPIISTQQDLEKENFMISSQPIYTANSAATAASSGL